MKKFIIFFSVLFMSCVFAATPTTLSYEGRLTDKDGGPLTGLFNMRFSICADADAAITVWGPEERPAIRVSNGVFSVRVGDVLPITAPVFSQPLRYLRVEIANPPDSTNFETIVPLSQIHSSAYSFRSGGADMADTVSDEAITEAKMAAKSVSAAKINAGNTPAKDQSLFWDGTKLIWSTPPSTPGNNSTFTNDDLVSGVLSVAHNLNSRFIKTNVFDNNGSSLFPDDIVVVDENNVNVDLRSYVPIVGTWSVVITK